MAVLRKTSLALVWGSQAAVGRAVLVDECHHADRMDSAAVEEDQVRESVPEGGPTQMLPELVARDLAAAAEVVEHPIEEQQVHALTQADKPGDARLVELAHCPGSARPQRSDRSGEAVGEP